MSRIGFHRQRARLKGIYGIKARLVLLTMILVVPLMLERVRSLEGERAKEIASASSELQSLAQHSAAAQREIISSVEAVLKSSAYIHASAAEIGRSCATMRASLRVDLPSIRMLMAADKDGVVRCSTSSSFLGTVIRDRPYFQKAKETNDFVVSDFMVGQRSNKGTILAAYPVSAISPGDETVIIAGLNLDWMSGVMSNLGGRPGVTAALVDRHGIVLASTPDKVEWVGKRFSETPNGVAEGDYSSSELPPLEINQRGSSRAVLYAPISGTTARLVVSIDESEVSAQINGAIRNAYLQLALVCLIALIGALFAAERLIVRPINMLTDVAGKFGHGNWSARVEHKRLPAEFVPLARAFNAMAARLAERERGLVAINNRLTVMASIDVLSGLANRRGFQSRLDFEWMKAEQTETALVLLMIDVDHFKPFNDTYGHPEGDACISQIGATLAMIANDANGFAARYGGEEFCLLLPHTEIDRGLEVGNRLRAAIEELAIPHRTSPFQHVTISIGVAGAYPSSSGSPRDLLEAADAALYTAKHRGRNAVAEHGLPPSFEQTGVALAS
ncbi:diguanylate cyclase [Rhodopseudomonas faecalis]|uniref:diguanylate cyclase n=1 Tax=Rhodopseudomonas faecalis TaxID=99655 RepID=A0A318TF20_9BRAD|nr:diguanylate cyclase [Rhodopseudomonas faecalis]PYF02427.1 diguanylate cyclase [Rhodopseudomonas faecalis]